MNAIIIFAATLNLTYLPQDAVATTTKDITYKKTTTNTVAITYTASTNNINLTYAPTAKNNNIHVPYYKLVSYKWNMKKIGR